MTGPAPEEWEDGLAQPVEPFRTPAWFVVVIALAVVGCVVGGLIVLL